MTSGFDVRPHLRDGHVIPAVPLMLGEDGVWSQRHQRAFVRYVFEAGCGGLAAGVHATQFAIRDPAVGLLEPVLALVADEVRALHDAAPRPFAMVAGVCGKTPQAVRETELARSLGYHAVLVSLTAMAGAPDEKLVTHLREVGTVLPAIGFYLQPAVGGQHLPYRFWRTVAEEVASLAAIKVAPFDRYRTLDVIRAVVDAGRDDVALYTGNDDNIIADLLTRFDLGGGKPPRFFDGGLLGQWAVWTRNAVLTLKAIKASRAGATPAREDPDWLALNARLTEANGAIFDAANGFAGCLPGVLEVLRRDGLAPSARCLDPNETLSHGQADEITRILAAFPELQDPEGFVAGNRDRWLAG